MKILSTLFLFLFCGSALAEDLTYTGTWVTTNRRLDGTMTCKVTDHGDQRWAGHFYGQWQGQKFSYRVKFTGPRNKLRGTARIDGAEYDWTGEMNEKTFKGKFDGERYVGWFKLEK